MLAEFAFTPSIFDESAHENRDNWLDQLRALGAGMFPPTATSAVLIANLASGNWVTFTEQVIEKVTDHRVKDLCRRLLTKMRGQCVHRPLKSVALRTEECWGTEAISSAGDESIERIIATTQGHGLLAGRHPSLRCVTDVFEEAFWAEVSPSWAQPMTTARNQVTSLRKMCVHSEFLCLITPHIRGGEDDEGQFAVELIRSCFNRPPEFLTPEVEIHTTSPDRPDASDFPSRYAKRVSAIRALLSPALPRGQRLRLLLWPVLLDRFVIAGMHTPRSSGAPARSPRWGVLLPHIARKDDLRKGTPSTQWSLLERRELGDKFDRYCNPESSARPRAEEVVG